jgi:choloylglycine hydrolase
MKIFTFLIVSLFSLIATNAALACTDFKVTAKDGTVVVARTLEFAQDLKSNIMTTPHGQLFKTVAANGKAGLGWRAQYGYLSLDALNAGIAMDGINEKGLSFEFLYLPGETQYQTTPAGSESQTLPYYYLGDWVLGNFQSVDEVRAALNKIYVISQKNPQFGNMIFDVHAAITDASGKGIVVEFIKGKMVIHESIGVMTNDPTYDWHITNLRNYLNLSPYAPTPITANGVTYATTGQGSGMLGLPGDYSPPSRFVKAAFLLKTAVPANDAADAVNLAEHIINNFDIARGTVREKETSGSDVYDLTQWTVFKDLTHKMFYYKSYSNPTVLSIDLTKLNFAENAPRLKMPVASAPYVLDMTQQFMQKKPG